MVAKAWLIKAPTRTPQLSVGEWGGVAFYNINFNHKLTAGGIQVKIYEPYITERDQNRTEYGNIHHF